MRRYTINLGATTTAEGKVVGASSAGVIHGVRIALEGDAIDCPACQSQGKIGCVGPQLPELWMGRPVALSDDLCLCRCKVPPKLIAIQTFRFQTLDDVAASAPDMSYSSAQATHHKQQRDVGGADKLWQGFGSALGASLEMASVAGSAFTAESSTNVLTADEVKRRVLQDILSKQAREDSLLTPDMLPIGGPVRNRPAGIEMVKNNNWDNALNMAADPFGLLGEVPVIMDELGKLSQMQAKNHVDAMRQAMIKAGVKNVPTDYEYYISNSGSGIDFEATAKRLSNVYETHVRDQRLRETWGDNYESMRIGKSKMTVLEFEQKVLDVHLQATDVAYATGVDFIAKGKLAVIDGQYARTLGSFIDEQVRDQLRTFAKAEDINDGPMSNIWAINRRIKSEFVDGYGIPDGRIGFNIFHDTTLARKDGYTPQLSKWNAIRPGNFLIIRPTELGGPYVVPRQSIQPFVRKRQQIPVYE